MGCQLILVPVETLRLSHARQAEQQASCKEKWIKHLLTMWGDDESLVENCISGMTIDSYIAKVVSSPSSFLLSVAS
jgi:hypothetical protein